MANKIKYISTAPYASAPIVDKLTFVLQYRRGELSTDLPEKVTARIEAALETPRCNRWYPSGGRYRHNITFVFDNGREAKIQIGATKPGEQNGGIRIELNPVHQAAADFEALHAFMGSIIGNKRYRRLLLKPLLNRVDFAIDVHNLSMADVLIDYQNAQRLTMFGKRMRRTGVVETMNFGSQTSAYMTTVYGKHTHDIHQAIKELGRDGLRTESMRANVIKQLEVLKDEPSRVRIEVRGKKLKGLALPDLINQPNRFKAFKFIEIAGLQDRSPFVQAAFMALCRDKGAKAALDAFKGKKVHKHLQALTQVRPAWWDPEDLWRQSFEALRDTGVFPDEAFDE